MSPLALNSEPKLFPSTTKTSNYRSGTLPVKKTLGLSPDLTTEVPSEHSSFTILPGKYPPIPRRDTFNHVKNWLEEVKNNGNPHMEILLVGNKNDLEEERTVTHEEG